MKKRTVFLAVILSLALMAAGCGSKAGEGTPNEAAAPASAVSTAAAPSGNTTQPGFAETQANVTGKPEGSDQAQKLEETGNKTENKDEKSTEETGTPEKTADTQAAKEDEKAEKETEETNTPEKTADTEATQGDEKDTSAEKTGKYNMKKVAGRYYLTGMISKGIETGLEDLAWMEELGFEATLDLDEDGTVTIDTYGQVLKGEWDGDNISIPDNDEIVPYLWSEEGGLTMQTAGITMRYTRQTATELWEAMAPAPDKEDEKGEEDGKDKTDEKDDTDKEETSEEKKDSNTVTVSGEDDLVRMEIVGIDWVPVNETGNGQTQAICVWYDLTNLSDDYYLPYGMQTQIVQDGNYYEEGSVYTPDDQPVDGEEYRFRYIRPGVTIRGVHLFPCDPNGGKIDYQVRSGPGRDVLLDIKIDLSDLPGEPEASFRPEEIREISWLDGIPSEGAYDDYVISIADITRVSSDYSEDELVRVYFDFTNNSDEAISFYMAATVRVIQDGVSLVSGWSSFSDPDLETYNVDVQPGGSIRTCLEWTLLSDSPVAVELYDWYTGDVILGKTARIK